jgi:hypothetical protein
MGAIPKSLARVVRSRLTLLLAANMLNFETDGGFFFATKGDDQCQIKKTS